MDEDGLASANNPGQAQITAAYQMVQSAPFEIRVPGTERTGAFQGLNGYNVLGATRVSDDAVMFDSDFVSSSGPGLFVYLSNNASNVNGGVELGALQSTTGAQTYALPQNVEANTYNFVIVYCKPFSVAFGSAELN